MNTNISKQKQTLSINALTWAWRICLALTLTTAIGQTNTTPQRIGIYDSRAVAVAFSGSAAFQEWMKPIKADRDRAKAAGDEQRLKEIDAEMRAHQKLAHKQAFSTAPVDNLLKHIERRMENIKAKAGVGAIISKWDIAAVETFSSAEKIDVTMLLVDEFHPNDRQRKSAVEIQKQKPITLKEAENING